MKYTTPQLGWQINVLWHSPWQQDQQLITQRPGKHFALRRTEARRAASLVVMGRGAFIWFFDKIRDTMDVSDFGPNNDYFALEFEARQHLKTEFCDFTAQLVTNLEYLS